MGSYRAVREDFLDASDGTAVGAAALMARQDIRSGDRPDWAAVTRAAEFFGVRRSDVEARVRS